MIWSLVLAALAAPDTLPRAVDLPAIQWSGHPELSPEGRSLLFSAGGWSFDPEAGPGDDSDYGWTHDSQLYLLPTDGGELRRLTSGSAAPYEAIWSPDGRTVAFVRHTDGDARVHLLPVDGGEARTLDLDGLSPSSLAFSPDGKALRFLATPEESEEDEAEAFRTGDVVRFERDRANSRLYSVDIAVGDPVALTDGSQHVLAFVEAHGGGRFGLTLSEVNNSYANSIEPRLAVLDGESADAVPGASGCIGSVAFSPDDSRLAWVGCATGGITDALQVAELASGRTWNTLADSDPTVEDFVWMPDGKTLLAHVTVKTRSQLWTVPASGGKPDVVPFDGVVLQGLELGAKGKRLYTRIASTAHPPQMAWVNLKNGHSTVLHDPNPGVADWALSKAEVVRWTGAEGTPLEGILSVPPGSDGRPSKLVVMPHGGPDSVSTERFDAWAQYFGAHGYALFHPNYRGGLAYGRDFYSANRGRLGEIEFQDIEAGVDHLVATGKADAEHLYYGGWSWGGYLTAWTIGHTDRYRAAVAGAAVVDTVAQYVGSDINHGKVADWEFQGRPWAQFEKFDAANPRRSLHEAKTPTLVLHGDADRRVPFAQGVTLFRALSDSGVETEFYVYPGEGHGLSEPAHRVHRLEVWLDWLESH